LQKLVFPLVLIGILGLATACSEVKKIDEMKDNTSQMNETTKTLLEKTGDMKDKLGEMSKTTDELDSKMHDLLEVAKSDLTVRLENVEKNMAELFDSMRQGDGSGLRRAAFDKLQSQRSLQGRVAEAGLYLVSFEFQVMGSVGIDQDIARRELLYQQAVLEFFLKIDELALKGGKVMPHAKPDVDDPMSEENRASAFNAFAFALHKVNRKQAADPNYGRPLSMYDLIMNALLLKPEIDNGRIQLPAGPHYIKEVLARPDRVRQLLMTRYNMFAYGVLGLSTNVVEQSTLRQALTLLGGLDIDISEKRLGVAGLSYLIEEILEPAARTTRDMYAIGLRPEKTSTTRFVLSRSSVFPVITSAGLTAQERRALELWMEYKEPNFHLGSAFQR
jgi:hypothetical protein